VTGTAHSIEHASKNTKPPDVKRSVAQRAVEADGPASSPSQHRGQSLRALRSRQALKRASKGGGAVNIAAAGMLDSALLGCICIVGRAEYGVAPCKPTPSETESNDRYRDSTLRGLRQKARSRRDLLLRTNAGTPPATGHSTPDSSLPDAAAAEQRYVGGRWKWRERD
jgi:hypothetical protein